LNRIKIDICSAQPTKECRRFFQFYTASDKVWLRDLPVTTQKSMMEEHMYALLTRRLALVSGLALVLNFMGTATVQADELDDITKAGVIKVGIFEDFPPFSSAGTDLKSQGYDIDVINALAKALNVTPELTGITGQNRIPSLTEHKLNLLVSVGVSDERKKVVAFTAPYAPYSIDVMGPQALAVKGPSDLAGSAGAVTRGPLEATSVTDVAPAGTDIQRFNDYNGVISAFLSGQVQLMVVGNDVGAAVLAKQPSIEPESKFQLLNSPSAMAINKGEDRLLAKIDEALAQMKKDGTLDTISKKWLFIPLPPEL
jgi:polar amino acid transport system substrate-binding protein